MIPDTSVRLGNISINEVLKARAMVAYVEDSIVIREIVLKPGGSVTIFAFDEDRSLIEHVTPSDALTQVLEGLMEISIAGTSLLLHAGEMLLLPSQAPLSVKALKRVKIILTLIQSDPRNGSV